jgi:hypothetical protein
MEEAQAREVLLETPVQVEVHDEAQAPIAKEAVAAATAAGSIVIEESPESRRMRICENEARMNQQLGQTMKDYMLAAKQTKPSSKDIDIGRKMFTVPQWALAHVKDCPNKIPFAAFGKTEAFAAIVLDEAYAEYVRRTDYQDGAAIACRRPRTLVLRTFSKIYGLAGYRVGYAIGDVELIRLLESLRDAFNVTAVGQIAAVAALADTEHLRRTREHNDRELPRLAEGLQARGLVVTPSQANFLLVTLPADFGALTAAVMNVELMKRALIVRPVANYDLHSSLRITVGTERENDKLLGALDDILQTVPR